MWKETRYVLLTIFIEARGSDKRQQVKKHYVGRRIGRDEYTAF